MRVTTDIAEWFNADACSSKTRSVAAERVLTLIGGANRSAFELATSELLAVLARGQQLPAVTYSEAQRHFAAALAPFEDGAGDPREDRRRL